MTGPGWEEAAAFLTDGAFATPPEVIETHSARIYLTPERAWKLRRPVDYGWLDYATRARRRAMAEREIALNAPHAPGLYLGLGGVADGPRLIGPETPVPPEAEPLVAMRRFPDADLMDRMAEAGRLTPELMASTGRVIAAMHRAGEPLGTGMRMPAMIAQEASELAPMASVLGPERAEAMLTPLRAEAAAQATLPAARPLRHCHGDLHLGNLVLWRGAPTPFDCIEFSEVFSRIDPLYDLAFLLMDLRHRGLGRLRAPLLSAWAEALAAEPQADPALGYGGLGLLPLYEGCRAAIRAKTGALAAAGHRGPSRDLDVANAHSYADLAAEILSERPQPRVIAVGGLSGSGKSVLAAGLASRLGAVVLRSDAIRKGMAGIALSERAPDTRYTAPISISVYRTLRAQAGMALAGGCPVVLDATHLSAAERGAAAELARKAGVPFAGLWLEAPRGALNRRLEARRGDPSDATPAVLARQEIDGALDGDWVRLDASHTPDAVLAEAATRLMIP